MITATITSILKYGTGFRVEAEFSDGTSQAFIFAAEATSDEVKARVSEVKAEKEALAAKVEDLTSELVNFEI